MLPEANTNVHLNSRFVHLDRQPRLCAASHTTGQTVARCHCSCRWTMGAGAGTGEGQTCADRTGGLTAEWTGSGAAAAQGQSRVWTWRGPSLQGALFQLFLAATRATDEIGPETLQGLLQIDRPVRQPIRQQIN